MPEPPALPGITIRTGRPDDLPEIAAIQARSPEAAQWDPAGYGAHMVLVAEHGGRVAGFAVCRSLGGDESELLNLAVAPELRRRGIARRLVAAVMERCPGDMYLEVRESNAAACGLYEAIGFKRVGLRPGYYESPLEAGIVMKISSC